MANTILFVSDEHNPRYAAPYGHPMVATPTMERLAEEGALFQNAYCPSPLCLPSRSAFMAGRWVHEIGTYSNCNVGMEAFDYPTYGAVLAQQGVHTVHVGKTHVYRAGPELGFSEMIAPGDVRVPGDANHSRTPLAMRPDGAERAGNYGPAERPFATDLQIMDAALGWLAERAPQIDAPWLLSINIHKPHFPHYVTQELWDMYPEGGGLPAHGADGATANHPYAQDLRYHFQTERFSEADVRGLRRGYLGCVTFVDRQLARVLAALEAIGQRDSTNVIYTTDHGDMLGKFGMWWKCSLYEDSVRIPLIAAGPDFAAGQRVTTPVSAMDLQATLFRCFGAERPAEWRGQPLQEVAVDDDERVVFAEYHGHGTRSGAYMVRKGDWKLIYCMAAPHQLFNLAEDPEELRDLAAAHPAVVAELEAHLRAICSPEAENARAHAFERQQIEALAAAKS